MFRIIQNACRSTPTIEQFASTFLGNFSRSTRCEIRWTNTQSLKPYKAAILEDFDKKLVIETIKNRSKLGDGMVSREHHF